MPAADRQSTLDYGMHGIDRTERFLSRWLEYSQERYGI
jgi:hypothetical protein